ncbi:MAG: hypothetical protein V1495_01435 [Pseudomonadota bacterium]
MTVICSNAASCSAIPVANLQMAGCVDGNTSATCDSSNLSKPYAIDGYDVPIPDCSSFFVSAESWGCPDSGPAGTETTGVWGLVWNTGATVFIHQNESGWSSANLKAVPRGKLVDLANNRASMKGLSAGEGVDPALWTAFADSVAGKATASFPLDGQTSYTYGAVRGAAGFGDRSNPAIVVINAPSTGGVISFNSSGYNDALEGWGILLIQDAQVQFNRNFRFNGIVIVRGPGSSVNLFSTTTYVAKGQSYVFGASVMIDALPDMYSCPKDSDTGLFSCTKSTSTTSNRHGLRTATDTNPTFPRFRYSSAAIDLAVQAYNSH